MMAERKYVLIYVHGTRMVHVHLRPLLVVRILQTEENESENKAPSRAAVDRHKKKEMCTMETPPKVYQHGSIVVLPKEKSIVYCVHHRLQAYSSHNLRFKSCPLM